MCLYIHRIASYEFTDRADRNVGESERSCLLPHKKNFTYLIEWGQNNNKKGLEIQRPIWCRFSVHEGHIKRPFVGAAKYQAACC